MPLAAAAATKKLPSDKQLVMSVEEILAGEDVQSFALSALMKRLRERRTVAVPAPPGCMQDVSDDFQKTTLSTHVALRRRGEARRRPDKEEAYHQGDRNQVLPGAC